MVFDWIAGTALVVGMGSLYLTYQSTKSAKIAIDTSIELYEKQKRDDDERIRKEDLNEIKAIRNIASTEAYSLLQHIKFISNLSIIMATAEKIDLQAIKRSHYRGVFVLDKNGEKKESEFLPDYPQKFSHDFMILSSRKSEELTNILYDMNIYIIVIENIYKDIFTCLESADISKIKKTCETLCENKEITLFKNIIEITQEFDKEMYYGYKNNYIDLVNLLKERKLI